MAHQSDDPFLQVSQQKPFS